MAGRQCFALWSLDCRFPEKRERLRTVRCGERRAASGAIAEKDKGPHRERCGPVWSGVLRCPCAGGEAWRFRQNVVVGVLLVLLGAVLSRLLGWVTETREAAPLGSSLSALARLTQRPILREAPEVERYSLVSQS